MWLLDSAGAMPLWRPDPESVRIRAAFSTRRGGVSRPPFDTLNLGRSTEDRPEDVAENRRRFLSRVDLDPERLANAGQVHGAEVRIVASPGLVPSCDGLVTREPALALAVTGADCLPLLFEARTAVGAAHAGWRGVVAGVAEATLASVCETAGEAPERVRVHFGPCIRECCYVVGPEVASRFPTEAVKKDGDTLRLSLVTAVRRRLLEAGVRPDALGDTGACTACEPSLYFSHRRDAGRTGRHWGVIALARS